MNIEPFDESLLTAYLDGELSPIEIEYVEQAMAASPQLRQSYEELKCLRSWIVSAVKHANPMPTAEPATAGVHGNGAEHAASVIEADSQWPWFVDEGAMHAKRSTSTGSICESHESAVQSERPSSRRIAVSRMGWTAFAALAATLLIVLLGGGVPLVTLRSALSFAWPTRDTAGPLPSRVPKQPPGDPIAGAVPVELVVRELVEQRAPESSQDSVASDPVLVPPQDPSAKRLATLPEVDGFDSEAADRDPGEAIEELSLKASSPSDAPSGAMHDLGVPQSNRAIQLGVPLSAWNDQTNIERGRGRWMEKAIPNAESDIRRQEALSRNEPVPRFGQAEVRSAESKALDENIASFEFRKSEGRSSSPYDPVLLAQQPAEIPEPSSQFFDWLGDRIQHSLQEHSVREPSVALQWVVEHGESSTDSDDAIPRYRTLSREGVTDDKRLAEPSSGNALREPATRVPEIREETREKVGEFESQEVLGRETKRSESLDLVGGNPASLIPEIQDPGKSASSSSTAAPDPSLSQMQPRLQLQFRFADGNPSGSELVAKQWDSSAEGNSNFNVGLPSEWTATRWFRGPPMRTSVGQQNPIPNLVLSWIEPRIESDLSLLRQSVPPANAGLGAAESPIAREGVGPRRMVALEFVFEAEETAAAMASLKGLGIQWEANDDWPSRPVVLLSRLSESDSAKLASKLQSAMDVATTQRGLTATNAHTDVEESEEKLSSLQLEETKSFEAPTELRSLWLLLIPTQAAVREPSER